ncbi:hypothetical protein [Kitasatospora sp. CB01950]|uniref:hypothetical protein n=1 Tax=Kitasatospora sp. CB01950 TaxID=1703930 RepID=UPI00093D285E|nr:hypothetical protein [Kitasatospora sp. CB01950]OKJ06796.1 hypothetical protein AMK19_23345 [Kitasatospora sp. CB01950]
MASDETLASLVSEQAGAGRRYTFAALSERSIDPQSGYRLSHSQLHKISKGDLVKINPELIRALSEGLSLPWDRVAAAAARQYIGYAVEDPGVNAAEGVAVRVARAPGASGGTSRSQDFVNEVLAEESDEA